MNGYCEFGQPHVGCRSRASVFNRLKFLVVVGLVVVAAVQFCCWFLYPFWLLWVWVWLLVVMKIVFMLGLPHAISIIHSG